MFKKKILTVTTLLLPAIASNEKPEDLKGYHCVSSGFRQPLKWGKASQPRIFTRYKRKAMFDLKGKIKLVFPLYLNFPQK